MQVPCDEGVAIHIGPKSCAAVREGRGEALTGECTGQPLSRERVSFWVPTPCKRWKAISSGAAGMSRIGLSRPLLRLHKGGRYRSEADMRKVYEYAP